MTTRSCRSRSPFESANRWCVIAVRNDWHKSTSLTSNQLCQRVAEILFHTKGGMRTPKYIVVNDDIDITNTNELVWAFAPHNHPGSRGELIYDAATAALRTTKVIYNCLHPEHLQGALPRRSALRYFYPEFLQARVLKDWTAYGYPEP